jgi:hypothetical protein
MVHLRYGCWSEFIKDFGIGFSGRGAVRCGHSSIEGFTLTKN